MKKIKALLARAKPWLKQHWHMVLVVAVAAAIFLYIVLRKGTGASAIAFPPATVDPNAGGAATGGAIDTSPAATPVSNPTPVIASGTAGRSRGTSGGSLFDPPAQLKSIASSQAIPTPSTFSRVPRFPIGGQAAGAAAAAASLPLPLGGIVGWGASIAAGAAQSVAAMTGRSPQTPLVVARPPAPRQSPTGISLMWNAANALTARAQRSIPTPPTSAPVIPTNKLAVRQVPRGRPVAS